MSYRDELTKKYGTGAFGGLITDQESERLFSEEEDHIKVKVTYPDGYNGHEITIGEIKERFKHESRLFRYLLVNSILTNGVGHSGFGEYELIDKSLLIH